MGVKCLFEDGKSYFIEEAANSELGIKCYDYTGDWQKEHLKLLGIRYQDWIKLEFGPGRNGDPPIKKPHATIGLNPSADPKSDLYWDLSKGIPLPDNCIDEAFGNQFLEHIGGKNRIHFMNECYRVLKSGGIVTFDVPHWQSIYAGGDPTHKWPPFTEASFQYYCLRGDRTPFVDAFSDYGIVCRFMLDEPLTIQPGIKIIAKLRKP